MTTELLTIDMFSDKVGQAFALEEAELPAIDLVLAECKAIPNYANAARKPFSLLFKSQGVGVLPQRMYRLQHTALGSQIFFLVPIGMTDDVVTYQAIFN